MATTEQPPPATVLDQAGLTVEQLYDELTDNCAKAVRLDDLLYAAAERVPGLVPTRAEVEEERTRKLSEKTGESCSVAQLDGSDIVYVARVAVPRIVALSAISGRPSV